MLVLEKLFKQSDEWQAERATAREAANQARAKAMLGNENAAKDEQQTVDPQSEGQLFATPEGVGPQSENRTSKAISPAPKRDTPKMHARAAATAKAEAIGVKRPDVERAFRSVKRAAQRGHHEGRLRGPGGQLAPCGGGPFSEPTNGQNPPASKSFRPWSPIHTNLETMQIYNILKYNNILVFLRSPWYYLF
jgi:hypothetical protein